MKKFFSWVYYTIIGKLALCGILFLISGILYRIFENEVFEYGMLIFIAYPILITIYMIIYAWIINPLKELRRRIKK
jgi:hypothetical protein